MLHLQSSLTGDACEAVRGLLCDGSLYEVALQELENQFGNPVAVVQSTLDSVLQHYPVKHNDIVGLTSLSRALHTAVCVLTSMGYRADLAATSNMQQVVAKLPSALAWQWGQVEVEMMPRVPNLVDIDDWLRKLVLAGRRALPAAHIVERSAPAPTCTAQGAPPSKNREHSSVNISARRTILVASTDVDTSDNCTACSGGTHELPDCPSFLAMAPEERGHLVRSDSRCFRCLGTKHWANKCASKTICGESGCRGKHHRLLHVTAAPADDSSETSGAMPTGNPWRRAPSPGAAPLPAGGTMRLDG